MRHNEIAFINIAIFTPYVKQSAMPSYLHNNQEAETCFDVVDTSPALCRKSSVDVKDVLLHFKYIRMHYLI